MGYYTAYSLEMRGEDAAVEKAEKALLKRSADDRGSVDPDCKDLVEIGCVYAKLYDISDWISEIAPKHPDVLIILSGDGEDSDDAWEERWKGNDHELQKATIPPFQNKNLQI